jgi:hypothetical protein
VALKPHDPQRLLELIKLDPAIRRDMRYATMNNFTGWAQFPVMDIPFNKIR